MDLTFVDNTLAHDEEKRRLLCFELQSCSFQKVLVDTVYGHLDPMPPASRRILCFCIS